MNKHRKLFSPQAKFQNFKFQCLRQAHDMYGTHVTAPNFANFMSTAIMAFAGNIFCCALSNASTRKTVIARMSHVCVMWCCIPSTSKARHHTHVTMHHVFLLYTIPTLQQGKSSSHASHMFAARGAVHNSLQKRVITRMPHVCLMWCCTHFTSKAHHRHSKPIVVTTLPTSTYILSNIHMYQHQQGKL